MKELLTRKFWRDVKRTFEEAREGRPPDPRAEIAEPAQPAPPAGDRNEAPETTGAVEPSSEP